MDSTISKASETDGNAMCLAARADHGQYSVSIDGSSTHEVSRSSGGWLFFANIAALADQELQLGFYACHMRFADGHMGSILQHYGRRPPQRRASVAGVWFHMCVARVLEFHVRASDGPIVAHIGTVATALSLSEAASM